MLIVTDNKPCIAYDSTVHKLVIIGVTRNQRKSKLSVDTLYVVGSQYHFYDQFCSQWRHM